MKKIMKSFIFLCQNIFPRWRALQIRGKFTYILCLELSSAKNIRKKKTRQKKKYKCVWNFRSMTTQSDKFTFLTTFVIKDLLFYYCRFGWFMMEGKFYWHFYAVCCNDCYWWSKRNIFVSFYNSFYLNNIDKGEKEGT